MFLLKCRNDIIDSRLIRLSLSVLGRENNDDHSSFFGFAQYLQSLSVAFSRLMAPMADVLDFFRMYVVYGKVLPIPIVPDKSVNHRHSQVKRL